MEFTYDAYKNLIKSLRNENYSIASYHDWNKYDRCVILRHDIDYDISKAVKLACVEKELGVQSTYFVLVTSDFYNVFSTKGCEQLRAILDCGHEIGLHFDEASYSDIASSQDVINHIIEEAELLKKAIDYPIKTVSMHRPSDMILKADIEIPDIINSYGKVFFNEFKYISDSRRRWRESVEDILGSRLYDRLHILTHAFWYNDCEKDIHDSVYSFVNDGSKDRYDNLNNNISDLQLIMNKEEIR